MKLNFKKLGGLIPAIIQDNNTKEILMLGFMNKEAYEKTLKEQVVTFWSRTRKELWTKGRNSGNFLRVVGMKVDCDNDTLLVMVNYEGVICHTGKKSCFE